MALHYKDTNPTSADNISAGFATGDTCLNTVTYDRYVSIEDGVWAWESRSILVTPNEIQQKRN